MEKNRLKIILLPGTDIGDAAIELRNIFTKLTQPSKYSYIDVNTLILEADFNGIMLTCCKEDSTASIMQAWENAMRKRDLMTRVEREIKLKTFDQYKAFFEYINSSSEKSEYTYEMLNIIATNVNDITAKIYKDFNVVKE